MSQKQRVAVESPVESGRELSVVLARALNMSVRDYVQPALSSVSGSNLKGMQLMKLLQTGHAQQVRSQLGGRHDWCSQADVAVASARVRGIANSVEVDHQLTAVAELFRGLRDIENKMQALLRLDLTAEGERELFMGVLLRLTPNSLHQLEKYVRYLLAKNTSIRNLKQQMCAIQLTWRKLCLVRGLEADIDVLEWKRRYLASLMVSQPGADGSADIADAQLLLMDA